MTYRFVNIKMSIAGLISCFIHRVLKLQLFFIFFTDIYIRIQILLMQLLIKASSCFYLIPFHLSRNDLWNNLKWNSSHIRHQGNSYRLFGIIHSFSFIQSIHLYLRYKTSFVTFMIQQHFCVIPSNVKKITFL